MIIYWEMRYLLRFFLKVVVDVQSFISRGISFQLEAAANLTPNDYIIIITIHSAFKTLLHFLDTWFDQYCYKHVHQDRKNYL